MNRLMLLAVGGVIGTILRDVITQGVHKTTGGWMPWGTIVVNITGCVVIGAVGCYLQQVQTMSASQRQMSEALLMAGCLGAFTTFSSYLWQSFSLLREGMVGLAMLNIGLSNVIGLGAVWLGYELTRYIVSSSG